MPKKEEPKSLEAARSYLLKQFGEGAVMSLDGKVDEIAAIPTGSFLLDIITGIGGLPQGRVVEFFGAESSGKSTVLSSCAAQCQKLLSKPVLYLDFEHAIAPNYLRAQGVDLSKDWFFYSQPTTMEEGFIIAETYMGLVGLIVVDSVAAMLPQAALDGSIGDTHAGGIALGARVMAAALQKIIPVCSKTGTTMAFINQTRTKFGATGITTETTPGGKSLKFYASMRIKFKPVGTAKGNVLNPITGKMEPGVVATKVRAEVVKNKLAPPFRKADFIIRYGIGVDDVMSLTALAIERGLLKKSGSFITIPDRYHGTGVATKLQGLERVFSYFRDEWPSGFSLLEEDLKALVIKDFEALDVSAYRADSDGEDLEELLTDGVESVGRTASLDFTEELPEDE
jgi:recombination protein RecA